MQRSHLLCPTVHFVAVCLAAFYVAVAALHDQPFRAQHGLAFAGALDGLSFMWLERDHNKACKRKPL